MIRERCGDILNYGCFVERVTVTCASCGRSWEAAVPFSVYEQQAVESCPCSHCGAYTLCCHEPHAAAGRRPLLRRRRPAVAPHP